MTSLSPGVRTVKRPILPPDEDDAEAASTWPSERYAAPGPPAGRLVFDLDPMGRPDYRLVTG